MATQNNGKGNNTGTHQGNTATPGSGGANDPQAASRAKDTHLDPRQKRDTPAGERPYADDANMRDDDRTPAPGQKPKHEGQEAHGKHPVNRQEPHAADAHGKPTRDAAKPLTTDQDDARKPEARAAQDAQHNAGEH